MLAEVETQESPHPPIESLPPEILSEIFLLVIERPYRIFGHLYRGPQLLVRVCRLWRDIAQNCPALWSSFMVHWPENRQEVVGAKLLLDTLQQTGRRGLTMTIFLSDDFPSSIFKALVQHSSQWEDVHLPTLPRTQSAPQNLPPLHLPSLKSLVLGRQHSVEDLITKLSMFKIAPNLRSVVFHFHNTPSSDFDPSVIQAPWWQLTRLSMSLGLTGDSSMEASIEVLRLCPNLETLREETILNPDSGNTTVTLRKLRSFSVKSPQLLNYLDYPVLEHLSILPRYDIPLSVPTLSQLARSGCRLHSLHIWLMCQLEHPKDLFSCMPHLCKLHLDMEYYGTDTLELLECLGLDDMNSTLPNLNVLELKVQELFTGEALSEEIGELLVRIIDERRIIPRGSQVPQLRQVCIRCCKAGVEGVGGKEELGDQTARNLRALSNIDCLKAFKAEGLDLSIIVEQENTNGRRKDCVFL
ncbi:uncharacterized protein EV420DRAFT_1084639 [Desarmillaria tabescens]|uniref:F-box domain-containing protein n=1 Tax=Armillaria tabescens TaxID=1929756 RepID=A0AA39JJR9_ARMTA|nr:uncharacterized protein EV420DRAFT_1084639 [Desarmillaria tabescens]KAK0441748.1 hypothetical protein EV420DRAFT_1084639 [Desarmillaria tabescens]